MWLLIAITKNTRQHVGPTRQSSASVKRILDPDNRTLSSGRRFNGQVQSISLSCKREYEVEFFAWNVTEMDQAVPQA